MDTESEVKARILGLINECRRIFYENEAVESLSEEDVKVKLLFPLFEAFGWNIRDIHETRMEWNPGYDEKLEKGIEVDCVFWIGNNPHIFLEFKPLKHDVLAFSEGPDGKRIIEYAKKSRAKYAVFANFLKMSVIDLSLEDHPLNFQDISEYISRYDELKILMKPGGRQGSIRAQRELGKCFENFEPKPECENCTEIKRSICEATTKLKQLPLSLLLLTLP